MEVMKQIFISYNIIGGDGAEGSDCSCTSAVVQSCDVCTYTRVYHVKKVWGMDGQQIGHASWYQYLTHNTYAAQRAASSTVRQHAAQEQSRWAIPVDTSTRVTSPSLVGWLTWRTAAGDKSCGVANLRRKLSIVHAVRYMFFVLHFKLSCCPPVIFFLHRQFHALSLRAETDW